MGRAQTRFQSSASTRRPPASCASAVPRPSIQQQAQQQPAHRRAPKSSTGRHGMLSLALTRQTNQSSVGNCRSSSPLTVRRPDGQPAHIIHAARAVPVLGCFVCNLQSGSRRSEGWVVLGGTGSRSADGPTCRRRHGQHRWQATALPASSVKPQPSADKQHYPPGRMQGRCSLRTGSQQLVGSPRLLPQWRTR